MAWPNNNFNSFWEAMQQGPSAPTHNPPRGAGVDRAPHPPPPDFTQFMNPDFWNRWAQGQQGWEHPSAGAPPAGPWAHGRRGGGGGGRGGGRFGPPHHPHHHFRPFSGEEDGGEAERSGPAAHDAASEDDAFPAEYISDDEVAAATAAAEKAGEKSGAGAGAEKDKSPDTMMQDDNDAEDPPEEVPEPEEPGRRRHCGGGRHGVRGGRGHGAGHEGFGGPRHHGRRGGPRGPHHHGGPPGGAFGGMFGGGGPRRHSRGPHGHHHGPPPPPPFFEAFFGPPRGGPHGHHHHRRGPPPPSEGPAFDMRSLMAALANHPAAQQVRDIIERLQGQGGAGHRDNMTPGNSDDENDGGMEAGSFSPPLDLFEQADRWVLHLAVPGAKKEDVGVDWDADRSVLSVSGVVYRPGDEVFLQGLVSGERSVGLFAREVQLPPVGRDAKEEVDGDGIAAKMEEGVLVITVPKVEKDWTEVRRVEIQ